MPFKNTSILVRTVDGRNFTLCEPLVYITDAGQTIEVPVGAETDGASIPKEFWNILPPFGHYWLAAVMHDWLYRHTELTREQCDVLFEEAMTSLKVDLLTRSIIFKAVRLAGKTAFTSDRIPSSAIAS